MVAPSIRAGMLAAAMALGAGCRKQEPPDEDATGLAVTRRTLAERADLRAYEGAPPLIPHEIEGLGRGDCLDCHAEGDVISGTTGRPAPIVPHPHYLNCRQCHALRQSSGLFKDSTFVGLRADPSRRPLPAQPLGPPYIPHRVQDRRRCEVCHVSATAPPELVPRHGPRTNCQQCHVQLQASPEAFVPVASAGN